MKRTSFILSIIAFIFSVAALAIALTNHLARKRDLFGYDEGDFEDDMFDDMDFKAEPIDRTKSDLSVEAEGNTAPVGDDEAHPLEH